MYVWLVHAHITLSPYVEFKGMLCLTRCVHVKGEHLYAFPLIIDSLVIYNYAPQFQIGPIANKFKLLNTPISYTFAISSSPTSFTSSNQY